MKNLMDIEEERVSMSTIVQLTGILEAIASTNIARVKNQVVAAQQFFNELWNIYTQIRVDELFRFGRESNEKPNEKELFIVISSPGGFSGDIDQRLIGEMLKHYNPSKQDIVVIGHHGTVLLAQANIAFKKYFKLPEGARNINVEPLLEEIKHYKDAKIFYQTYISLMTQDIKSIDATAAIKELSEHAEDNNEIISDVTYIFEPSTYDVIAHLERSVLRIALEQVIFDSQLSQYASRFKAMTSANNRAGDYFEDISKLYNRARRENRDEQSKQIINDMRILNLERGL
ncbi:MAG TPA: F0F1 ATP synthase subunit gamma [Patescibacteria group bacterium]|jgi:ATP synthase F1 gamma subunit|nr:F0F1 ATP synthase subunit gamma [Patescibacteria group bacterium]